MAESFIKQYLQFTSDSEVPVCFNRWAAIAGISIILERNVWIPFGHSNIYPNQYLMLMGSAGTRKSTAIKLIKHLLIGAGYSAISAERTSKEKFLVDLAGDTDDNDKTADTILERNLFGEGSELGVHSMAIMADEANDFFGSGNLEFLSILGSLWDWQGVPYQNRIKTGKSVSISDPTINIFAGNTPTGFATAFPPEILGQGFFSRLLLVYSEPNGRKIAFPRSPDKEEVATIIRELQRIKGRMGEIAMTAVARTLLETIYHTTYKVEDMRFDAYFNRRFTHLLKLSMIITVANHAGHMREQDIIEAHTYLCYAESLMPKALGEFGKSRNSDVTHKVLTFIESHDGCTIKQLVKFVGNDLERPSDIGDILKKLSISEKIQSVQGIFLPMRRPGLTSGLEHVDLEFLTEEELLVKG